MRLYQGTDYPQQSCGLPGLAVMLGMLAIVASTARAKDTPIVFQEGIRQIQSFGSLVLLTLGNGDVVTYDNNGRIVARNNLGLNDKQFPILIPSDSLLVVVSNQWYSESSLLDRLKRIISDKSRIDIYHIGDTTRVASCDFDGDLSNIAYDSEAGLLAFCTLKDSYQALVVFSPKQNAILDEREASGSALDIVFEDSVIYMVASKIINRYQLRADGRALRSQTDLLECFLSQFVVHAYYSEGQKRLAAYNQCIDTTIGPIRLIRNDSIVNSVMEIMPDQLTPDWAWEWHYRHSPEELFLCDMSKKLYVVDFTHSCISTYLLGELQSLGYLRTVVPLEGGKCILVPCVVGERCTQMQIIDNIGILRQD